MEQKQAVQSHFGKILITKRSRPSRLQILTESWGIAWSWLARYKRWYLILSIILLWLAGIVTYFSLQMPNIAEANLALSNVLSRFGLWSVFLFDAGASMIFILLYKLTEKMTMFNVCMMLMILSATALDLTNNLTLLYAPKLYHFLDFENQKPLFSSFTRAEYDGLRLQDFAITCIGGNQVSRTPIGNPIYVGAGWQDPYPERNSIMHC